LAGIRCIDAVVYCVENAVIVGVLSRHNWTTFPILTHLAWWACDAGAWIWSHTIAKIYDAVAILVLSEITNAVIV